MSTVCGIDPSLTSAGIAVIVNGDPVFLRSVGLDGHNGASWMDRKNRVTAQALAITRVVIPRQPDLVVIEAPLTQIGTGDAFDRYALFLLGLLPLLADKGLPIATVHQATRATWVTGKGGSKRKAQVFAAIKDEWPKWVTRHLVNDDVADALVLAAMGATYLGDQIPISVPDWRRNNLDNVAWPETVIA